MQNTVFPRIDLVEIQALLLDNPVAIILGSRQVGKTTIVKSILDRLSSLENRQCLYIDLEIIENLKYFEDISAFTDYLRFKGLDVGKPVFVGIDEFYYLKNATKFFKIIADHHPNIHILASGSSAIEIKKHVAESLTGRKRLKVVYPLTFGESLVFHGSELQTAYDAFRFSDERKILLDDFQKELDLFILYGGYPRTNLIADPQQKIAEINEIYSSYIQKDIRSLIGDENIAAYNRLLKILSAQIGNLINVSELSNTLHIGRRVVEKYLFVLEHTYIISLVEPFAVNVRKTVTKTPKIFFFDTGIANMASENFTAVSLRPNAGSLVENFVFSELVKHKRSYDKIYFYRTTGGTEIDFIYHMVDREVTPVEVKCRTFSRPVIPRGMREFCRELRLPRGIILNKNLQAVVKEDSTEYFFLPIVFASKIISIMNS